MFEIQNGHDHGVVQNREFNHIHEMNGTSGLKRHVQRKPECIDRRLGEITGDEYFFHDFVGFNDGLKVALTFESLREARQPVN